MRLAIVALLVYSTAMCVGAAPAVMQFEAQTAPANVLAQMKDGGHSVRFQQVDMGPGQRELFCHIYTVGKRYFLDVFTANSTATFQRLNSVDLGDTPHSEALDVSFMWLQPKHWHGPILLLHDRDLPGEWDGSRDLFVFPDGFEGRVVQQTFLEVVALGTSINPTFDLYDERGLLIVTSWNGHEGQAWGTLLYWNGHGFAARKARYALIGPLFKTHAQAQTFFDNHITQITDWPYEKPPVYPSRYYKDKGIKSGLLVVVLGSFGLQKDADKAADEMRQKDISCSVLRLY